MITKNNIKKWCSKCAYGENKTPLTCDRCKEHESNFIRIFGNPLNYKPKQKCDHPVLEAMVVETNVYDNSDTVIVTRQDVCEECEENVGEPYDQVYALIEDK